MHESEQKQETNEKYGLKVVHHVVFKSDKSIIYGLFDESAMGLSPGRQSHPP